MIPEDRPEWGSGSSSSKCRASLTGSVHASRDSNRESLRDDADLRIAGLGVTRISRQDVSTSVSDAQPDVWTFLHFEATDDLADELARSLARSLD
ncbi:hypothetical protein GA0070609_3129 [Micromonospora echinaurantiaca]|uniref:Uncharacterized protein n=2 Tax=Micromonospora echinaurantiaca TaxID=47857 RepID=A0A1C5IDQ8_9ACTN|nr:hypothetical protein GA0070609_3129 [Micromonospora echinaurantiaca]